MGMLQIDAVGLSYENLLFGCGTYFKCFGCVPHFQVVLFLEGAWLFVYVLDTKWEIKLLFSIGAAACSQLVDICLLLSVLILWPSSLTLQRCDLCSRTHLFLFRVCTYPYCCKCFFSLVFDKGGELPFLLWSGLLSIPWTIDVIAAVRLLCGGSCCL